MTTLQESASGFGLGSSCIDERIDTHARNDPGTRADRNMPRVALHEPGLLVLDNVLPPEVFRALFREVANAQFRSVHADRREPVWRLWDGQPLRGGSVHYDPGAIFSGQGPRYPTATVVDLLIDGVREVVAAHPDTVGRERMDWIALYLAAWLYPVGSALSLHRDGDKYSGAFTFFVHPRWCAHWGGELLVLPPSSQPCGDSEDRIADDGDGIDDPGLAVCIIPKPNRLVLLGPDRPHRIARVDANAGTHARASIAGFFLRPPR